MSLVIARATASDIPIIQDIAFKTWPAAYDKVLSPKQTQYMLTLFYNTEALHDQMKEGNQQFLIISENNQHLGFAGYEVNYNNTTATKLHKLYILPNVQGKNIGKALTNEVIAIAKACQQNAVLLNVNIHNTAIGFYERMGFKIIAREDIPIGNDYYMNDYMMQLAL